MSKDNGYKPLMDRGLLKALAHPLRQEILRRMVTVVSKEVDDAAVADGAPGADDQGLLPRSPNQLFRELGEPLGNVSYHVKKLLECECVELIDVRPRRGAVEHFYLPTGTTRMRLMALASIGPEIGAEPQGEDRDAE